MKTLHRPDDNAPRPNPVASAYIGRIRQPDSAVKNEAVGALHDQLRLFYLDAMTVEQRSRNGDGSEAVTTVKGRAGTTEFHEVASGNASVSATFAALLKSLAAAYPVLRDVTFTRSVSSATEEGGQSTFSLQLTCLAGDRILTVSGYGNDQAEAVTRAMDTLLQHLLEPAAVTY